MIDIERVRADPKAVRENLARRADPDVLKAFDQLAGADSEWRTLRAAVDDLRAERNRLTEAVKVAKASGKDAADALLAAKNIPAQIKAQESRLSELEEQRNALLLRVPNLLDESVPFGKDDTENQPVAHFGEKPKISFPIRHHGEFAVSLGVADFERAVKVSGTGFFYLKGDLARLDFALQQLAMDLLHERGFTLIQPPFMMRRRPYEGVTDLADFENVMYKIEGEDNYLIATSEHPMAAMYMDEILDAGDLPLRYAGISPCFRREIGKHGLDERGFFRVHQFNKIEQFIFCAPEDSWKHFDELAKNSQEFYKTLGIHFRVVNVCTGDMGIVAAKKFDLEGWSPREEKYIELGSCSNCTDYQSNRLRIRARSADGSKFTPHTLNNTMVPTTRTLRVLLETFQREDGSFEIPKALRPYMGNQKEITAKPWTKGASPRASKKK